MEKVIVTIEEQKAISLLERLAKKWPKSLSFLDWSDSLFVCKKNEIGQDAIITQIVGIPSSGGDPQIGDTVADDSTYEIEYEI